MGLMVGAVGAQVVAFLSFEKRTFTIADLAAA
jgi:hypothetical protein